LAAQLLKDWPASGSKVAIIGRNAERGEARVAAIQKAGGTAAFLFGRRVETRGIACHP